MSLTKYLDVIFRDANEGLSQRLEVLYCYQNDIKNSITK